MPRHEESISSPTKSQSHITKITSNRKTNSTSMGKPLLVLHVGPRKTGTTTIQMSLGFDDSIKRTMRQDNFTIVNFNYLKFKALIKSCFDRKDECDEKRGGWNHLKMLYRIATRSTNAIHSVENYSTIPSDPYTIERIRSLQELYIIRVIIVYRPAHEWLISAYAQYEKWLLYNTRMQVWADWNDKQKRPRSSFTEYFDQFFPDHITDSLHTYDLFSKIFGSDAISVMSMPPGNALKEEFFCRALQNEAPKTCSAVVAENKKSPEESNHNPSSHFLFEEDRLILRAKADEKDLLPEQLSRYGATLSLQSRLEELNLTVRDMPQICLNASQEESLWNYTLRAEEEIAPIKQPKDELQRSFAASRMKFCGIDVNETLKGKTWRDILSSLKVFSPDGCIFGESVRDCKEKGKDERSRSA